MDASFDARHDFLRRYGVVDNWKPKTLGDLARVVGGGTPSRDESRFWIGGKITWATPTDITANQLKYISKTAECITEAGLADSAASLLPTGSILYTSRATIGAKAIAAVPIATNQGFANFLPQTVAGDYLYYLLDLLTPIIKRLGAGTTFDEVSKRDIRTVWCAVPSDLDEQAAIARILDAVDTLLERTHHKLAAAKNLVASLIEDAVSGKLITAGMRSCKNDTWSHPRLGAIPAGWSVDRLGILCKPIVDGTHQAVQTSKSGVPFLFVSCVREGRILWKNASFITEHTYARISKGREPEAGCVLYTAVGSYGNAALVSTSDRFSFQRHIAILYPKRSLLYGGYLAMWLNSSKGKRWSDIHAVGNAQKTVTLTELGKLLIAYPSPDVQEELFRVVAGADAVVDRINERLSALIDLKRSLMHDLLTGTVRVRDLSKVAAS